MDGRDELRFSRTHPKVWEFLMENFRSERRVDLEGEVYVFTRRALKAHPFNPNLRANNSYELGRDSS